MGRIFMFSLVFRQCLAMRNITLYSVLFNASGFRFSHGLQTPNERKKSEMFWQNLADKYALTGTKNFGLDCN